MSIYYDAPVTPDALTAFVREVPAPANLSLSNAIPTRFLDSNEVDFSEIVKTNRTAKFRAFDGRIPVSERDAGGQSNVRLLPLSNSLNMGEYERLQLEFARTGGTNLGALANAIYNDAEALVGTIRNRIEMAWGDVLMDGKLTVDENGYKGEADFGMPANHSVTASVDWTDEDAKILSDLLAWSETYVDTPRAGTPGALRTSTKIVRAMQKNKEIIAAVHGATSGKTRVTRDELNGLLASEGLPVVAEPYDLSLDVDGTPTRAIDEDKVIITPADLGDLGFTAYGVTVTAMELAQSNKAEMTFQDASGIVGIVTKEGPPFRQYTYVDAVAMPILTEPNRLMVASVA